MQLPSQILVRLVTCSVEEGEDSLVGGTFYFHVGETLRGALLPSSLSLSWNKRKENPREVDWDGRCPRDCVGGC